MKVEFAITPLCALPEIAIAPPWPNSSGQFCWLASNTRLLVKFEFKIFTFAQFEPILIAPPFSLLIPLINSILSKTTLLTLSLMLNILDFPSASKTVPSTPMIEIGLSITIFPSISFV